MKNSLGYIVGYASLLTIICGVVLALAAVGLKNQQDVNIALKKKENILLSAGIKLKKEEIQSVYDKQVVSYVINAEGKKLDGKKAEDIVIADEYKKKDLATRLLPIYEITNAQDKSKIEAVVVPLYGYGLWDNIWGYVSLQSDMNTIKGTKFEHKAETPGLGARIGSDEIQNRYLGKKLFDGNKLMSVMMQKGEGEKYDSPYKIDGMSGATITGKGLNTMLTTYFGLYSKYLKAKATK
jgi:Na+-transporting NADH:ubiquinone oxidoreductase subunit C